MLFLAVLNICCCVRAFSSCGEWGLLFVVVPRLLITVASPVAEHKLQGGWASVAVAHGLSSCSSQTLVHGLSWSMACGIFPNWGSNQCPLYCRQIRNHWTTKGVLIWKILALPYLMNTHCLLENPFLLAQGQSQEQLIMKTLRDHTPVFCSLSFSSFTTSFPIQVTLSSF